jgi:hypothetical protein
LLDIPATMTVPEAAIGKNCRMGFGKNKIGTPDEFVVSPPTLDSKLLEYLD